METAPESPRRDNRTLLGVVLVLVTAWALYLIAFGPRRPPGGNGFATGRQADYDWAVETLDGQPADFASFRGRTIFLNVWATWCPPCVAEMPSIVALAGRPEVRDVAFVCVSQDDELESVRRFARAHRLEPRLTILRATGPTPPVFETSGIPATFLVGPDGKIARSEVGSLDWDDPKVARTLADLAKPATTPTPSP